MWKINYLLIIFSALSYSVYSYNEKAYIKNEKYAHIDDFQSSYNSLDKISLNEEDVSEIEIKANLKCQKEEFIPHPRDQTKYYRCVRRKSGKYKLYEFSCHSGTIWDQKKQMCAKPRNVHGTSNFKINEEANDTKN